MLVNEKICYAPDPHLSILRISESAYLIEDDRNATGYVICGKNHALVVDTCFGYENYLDVVRSITDLPVIVVNTHAHLDHCGGNGFFASAYIGEAELPAYNNTIPRPQRKNIPPACPAKAIHDGDKIDLGDREIEVIHFAGHTPGALCLLDPLERILYTGDSILSQTIYLFMDNSVPVSEMKASLLHVNEFRSKFDYLATGHGSCLESPVYIDKLISACECILANEPAECFGSVELFGKNMRCCYYSEENGRQSPLIFREDLVK